jgi:DNA-binding winged helix-turn-helix (wHTH) protein/Tfp pilus assembly protein PilF
MSETDNQIYEFGPFLLDPGERRLQRNGELVPLTPKAFDLLLAMVEQPGRLIEKEVLLRNVWPDTFIEEHNLADNISRLRKALREDQKGQKLIETVPKRGYRFVAEVRKQNGAEDMPTASVDRPIRRRAIPVLWVLLPILLLAGGLWSYAKIEQRARVQQLVFQGNFYRAKWTEPEIRKAIELYNRALALNPNAGETYAGLANAWLFLSDAHVAPRVAMPKAKAAALHVLRLDGSAHNHVSIAVISMQYEWDWVKAEEEFKHAFKLDPHHNPAHQLYGWYLMAVGRLTEAQAEMKRALEADPVNDFSLWELGLAYYFARQFDEAVEHFRRAIALEARSHWPHMFLAWAFERQGKLQEAVSELNLAARLDDNPQVLASLGHAHAASGRRDDAQRVIAELEETAKRRYVSPYDIAAIHAALQEQTLRWLERAYDDRSGWLALWLKVDPRFDLFRSEPVFQNILRQVGHTL